MYRQDIDSIKGIAIIAPFAFLLVTSECYQTITRT